MDYRTTTTGIHREDFIFLMNGQNVIEKASQGQKKNDSVIFETCFYITT